MGAILQYPQVDTVEDPLAVIEKKYVGMTKGLVIEEPRRGAWWADYTGDYVVCDTNKPNWFVRIFKRYKKCWKVVDPERYWREKW